MSGPILLVDCSSVAYAAAFKMSNLSWEGEPTGAIYGFLRTLLVLQQTYSSTRFMFAWDSRTSLRKLDYPGYKDKTGTEIRPEILTAAVQIARLRKEILPGIGFVNSFQQEGLEADDLIAQVCKQLEDERIVIVSSDEDLYQLITNRHLIHKHRDGSRFTLTMFREAYGIEPSQWVSVKALAGCSSDKVLGVPGVGEKTAIQYLRGKIKGDSKKRKAIAEHQDRIALNYKLVRLPHEKTQRVRIQRDDLLDFRFFLDLGNSLGFYSMVRRKESLDEWREFFGRN